MKALPHRLFAYNACTVYGDVQVIRRAERLTRLMSGNDVRVLRLSVTTTRPERNEYLTFKTINICGSVTDCIHALLLCAELIVQLVKSCIYVISFRGLRFCDLRTDYRKK